MWEYSYLSKIDLEQSGESLDQSDLMIMIVEDFTRLLEFYNREKTFKVCDDETMMDIFKFFVDRDLMLEATILAEKELSSNIQEEEKEIHEPQEINEGNEDTEVIDRMITEELDISSRSRLSKQKCLS